LEVAGMPKINIFADSLHVLHNGKPEDIDKKYRQRKKNYIIKVDLYSPGYNSNKRIEGGISFLDLNNGQINFGSSFALEDIHLLTCNFGTRVDLKAHVYYVEYEDFLTAVLRSLVEGVAGKFIGYAKKLDLKKIARIPADILPIFVDVIKNGIKRKSSMYEIGSGRLTSLKTGINEIELAVEEQVRRTLAFWTPDRGDYAREEVVLIPRGLNGRLSVMVEPV
jgi:hypothetical protein